MIVPRRPDSLSPFRLVRLTPAGIHRVELVLTHRPLLQRLPQPRRLARAPRHQPAFRSPVVSAAESREPAGLAPRADDSAGASCRATGPQPTGSVPPRGLLSIETRAEPPNKVLQLSSADGRASRSLWRLQLNTGTLCGRLRARRSRRRLFHDRLETGLHLRRRAHLRVLGPVSAELRSSHRPRLHGYR